MKKLNMKVFTYNIGYEGALVLEVAIFPLERKDSEASFWGAPNSVIKNSRDFLEFRPAKFSSESKLPLNKS